jgi:peptide/nickel transport system permease protein
MTWYLIRRVGQAIAVLIGVMILTFILVHAETGSTARAVLGLKATPERIALFNRTYGLDKPLYEQFFVYARNLLHGNFGTSYQYLQPVSTLMAERLPRDAVLLGMATVLALIIGVPCGIYQAMRHNMLVDDVLAGTWFTLYSAPDFMEALLLIAIVCVQFHWLQPDFAGNITSVGGLLADWRALILPVVVLSINTVAGFSQYARSSAIQELASDYVRVVRAKGLPEKLVVSRHVLRNSLLPIVTILGLTLPDIVGGAIIAEAIFNFPGMGLLFWQAALEHDFPILLGTTFVVGVAAVVGNLLADIAYGVLDPRIRYAKA